MAIRTVVCPECDEQVPYGRLACPNCGTLIAAVTGAERPSLRAVDLVEESSLALEDEPWVPPEEPTTPQDEPATAPERDAEPPETPAPADLDDAAEPAPPSVEAPEPVDELWQPEPPSHAAASVEEPTVDGDAQPADGVPSTEAQPVEALWEFVPPVIGDWVPAVAEEPVEEPETAPAWRRSLEPTPWKTRVVASSAAVPAVLRDWDPDRDQEPAIDDDEPPSAARSVLYPSAAIPAGWAVIPAGSTAPPDSEARPAGSWVPPTPAAAAPASASVPATAAPAKPLRPGSAPLLADLPFDAPNDLAGWLVTMGALVALVGFLLPWSNTVIGAASMGGYTDRWGLANPTHLFAFAAVAITFAIGILPTRLPGWIRNGVLGLVLGGLLVGLAWPYVAVLPGAGVGVLAVAAAGLVLAVGGAISVRPRA